MKQDETGFNQDFVINLFLRLITDGSVWPCEHIMLAAPQCKQKCLIGISLSIIQRFNPLNINQFPTIGTK